MIAVDVVAITFLVFGLYWPRHRRKEMAVSYLVVNIGVLAVAVALESSAVGAGLGLGLFGVLSIIRLRSTELTHQEVAYYFASLTIGLLAGIDIDPIWAGPALMAVAVGALLIGDHPQLFGNYRVQVVTLDTAIADEQELVPHLENLLRARVHNIDVRKLDLVRDTTTVEVRYQLLSGPERSKPSRASLEMIGRDQ